MSQKPICTKPWTRILLMADGTFRHCCHQHKSVGNAYDGNFEQMWNNDNSKLIRQSLINGEIPKEFCGCIEAIGGVLPHDDEPVVSLINEQKRICLPVISNNTPRPFNIKTSNKVEDGIKKELIDHIKSRRNIFSHVSDEFISEWLYNRKLAITERNNKKIELSCKPIYLDIEMNNMCNLDCGFCVCTHYHVKNSNNPESKLTFNEIDSLSELFPYPEIIETSKAGEPFLTPDLFSYALKKIRQVNPFAIVQTTTNGTIMNNNIAESLIHDKLDHMYISISGDNKEKYKEVMGKDGFDKVILTLEIINNMKIQHSSKEPYLHFNIQLCKYNDPFVMMDIASQYGITEINFIKTEMFNGEHGNERFKGSPIYDYMKKEDIENLMDRIIEYANDLNIVVNFGGWNTKERNKTAVVDYYYYPHTTKYFDFSLTCPTDAPWFRYCTSMRKVQPCCWSAPFDDWTKKPFWEIWNGEYLKKLREQLSNGTYPSVCHCKY